ncbi:FMN-dependent NADH-azoreductase [Staphylospora marina]|uniref:FMN-dependent NADH-azoreductase n=1 Tax=Staphylospora marina TaxID=2490858 RepID=UPI000F5BB474|nr:FMN-dependent NADH-azoreductase [Staphylospora marina]
MAKLLYITANPKTPDESFSLRLGEAFLKTYREVAPGDEIIRLDLYKTDIPHIDADVFSGWGKLTRGEDLTDDERRKVERINELTEQFIEADKVVFVTPMWNFMFPPILKAYIDTIVMAGKTFKYTEQGPIGLLKDQGKKVVHLQARGGIYSEGPSRELEFGDRYLRAVLAFMGVTDVRTVVAEGMAFTPDRAEEIMERAEAHAQDVAVEMARS